MKLTDTRGAYDTYSGKASDLVRQLAFAGIAVIWVLRTGDKTGGIVYSASLLVPLGGLVFALALDLVQYAYGALAWGAFNRKMEKQLGANSDEVFTAPPKINYVSLFCFWAKLIAVSLSYIALLVYIGKAI